jgi:hypothetical protein
MDQTEEDHEDADQPAGDVAPNDAGTGTDRDLGIKNASVTTTFGTVGIKGGSGVSVNRSN